MTAPLATVVPPTLEQAEQMGRTGAPHDEHERLLYEAYCKGHCWAVGPWVYGAYYEMLDRIRFAMWRDRAALARQEPSQTHAADVDLCDLVGIKADGTEHRIGKIAMPPLMKAREVVRNYFGAVGSMDDDDSSDAAMALQCCREVIEHMERAQAAVLSLPVMEQAATQKDKKP